MAWLHLALTVYFSSLHICFISLTRIVQMETNKTLKHKYKEKWKQMASEPQVSDAESTATPVTQKTKKTKEIVLVENRQIPENILRTPVWG